MFLKAWRTATIFLTALSTGLSFAHLLEMPVRLNFPPDLWVRTTVYEGVYRYFAFVGAPIELGSILFVAISIMVVRKHSRPTFLLTLAAGLMLVTALAVWIIFVNTANAELATWLNQPVPADFGSWQRQWEYGHAVCAVLKICGLILLLIALVAARGETKQEVNDD